MLQEVGPLYGYFPKLSKSYLLLKGSYLENAAKTFRESEVKITKEGKKYLRTVIGSKTYKIPYTKLFVDVWN